jgi:hypothetical protein
MGSHQSAQYHSEQLHRFATTLWHRYRRTDARNRNHEAELMKLLLAILAVIAVVSAISIVVNVMIAHLQKETDREYQQLVKLLRRRKKHD